MNHIEQELEAFYQYLIQLGYHQNTTKILPYCVREFFDYIEKEILSIDEQDIIDFHHYLEERPNKRYSGGLSQSFIYQHLYAIRLFFTWQLEQGSLQIHPMSRLSFKPPSTKTRAILTQAEIKQVYESCESSKERALLAVFYGCGLRKSEGAALNIGDVDTKNGLLYVRRGKYAKRRVVPMGESVKQDLLQYIDYGRYGTEKQPAFFYNVWGRRMSGDSMSRILKSLMDRTKITKHITLHCLRHSIATHLLANGLSVEDVRDFLGHRYLESTQIYTRINQEQLWTLNNI